MVLFVVELSASACAPTRLPAAPLPLVADLPMPAEPDSRRIVSLSLVRVLYDVPEPVQVPC